MKSYLIRMVAASDEADLTVVRKLLQEYATSRKFDKALGDFEKELVQLPGEYGLDQHGLLLLAKNNKTGIGCIAYRRIGNGICEMKRMYVVPELRQSGIGRNLLLELITAAKTNTYHTMKLDTHPSMTAAQSLYQSFGFVPCAPYNSNPTPGIKFFKLDLKSKNEKT